MSNVTYTGNGTMDDDCDDCITIVSNGTGLTTAPIYGSTITMNTSASTISFPKASIEYILDTYEMNQVVVEHKVQEHELLKLKEVDPNFADHIKANLTKAAAEKIVNKMAFTKTKDKDMDVHSFRGRVWVFTKDELEQLIKDAQNA
jgi:hypothetical protein